MAHSRSSSHGEGRAGVAHKSSLEDMHCYASRYMDTSTEAAVKTLTQCDQHILNWQGSSTYGFHCNTGDLLGLPGPSRNTLKHMFA